MYSVRYSQLGAPEVGLGHVALEPRLAGSGIRHVRDCVPNHHPEEIHPHTRGQVEAEIQEMSIAASCTT